MKTINKPRCQGHRCDPAAKARCFRPQFEDRIRLLINAASAARAGTAQMTLNDWRELELEVNERLQNEHARIQR
jgi:hypothetical protein